MNAEKKHIIFTLPYREGGVASIVRNIIDYMDKHDLFIEVILVRNLKDPQAFYPENMNADKITVFDYKSIENKYAVYKRFCRLFTPKAIIISNDPFDLRAINTAKCNNKIIYVIHSSSDTKIKAQFKYEGIIDAAVGVSKLIATTLKNQLSGSSICVEYISQPIAGNFLLREKNFHAPLNIIFVGRFVHAKGIFDLPKIDDILKKRNIYAKWTIAGFGPEEEAFKTQWHKANNVSWTGKLTHEAVIALYAKNDLFILPSHSEGFPVVLIEAMKSGLVPLLTDLPGGIPEIIKDGATGYLFPINSPEAYADKIEFLHNKREKLEELSVNAQNIVNEKFDPYIQAAKYKELIEKVYHAPYKKKVFVKETFGILDKKFIPNFLVKFIREIRIKL